MTWGLKFSVMSTYSNLGSYKSLIWNLWPWIWLLQWRCL